MKDDQIIFIDEETLTPEEEAAASNTGSGVRYLIEYPNPNRGDYNAYLSCFDKQAQALAMADVVGILSFANGERICYKTGEDYLKALRDELPYRATTGCSFETVTDDPAIRKAVDDLVFDLYGEENPSEVSDYTPKKNTYTLNDIKNNSTKLQTMDNVAEINGDELGSRDIPFKKRITDFFASLGNNVKSAQFGDVELRNSSIHSEIRHGNTPPKVMTYAAIPDVIQRGVVIYHAKKNSQGLERLVVAAPVYVKDLQEKAYVGVMLQRDKQNQRLYLHDAVTETEKEIASKGEYLIPTGSTTNGGNLYATNILLRALNVKTKFSWEQMSTPDSPVDDLAQRIQAAAQTLPRAEENDLELE